MHASLTAHMDTEDLSVFDKAANCFVPRILYHNL